VGVDSELDAARLQLWEDRAAESRSQLHTLVAYLVVAGAVAAGLGVYYLGSDTIPDWLALVSFALAIADLIAIVVALRGRAHLAGVLAQVLPIIPVLIVASAFSVEAGFGSYLFIGSLGVMVTIPEGHNASRVVCVALLIASIGLIQLYFTRERAWNPLEYDQTSALNTFNRTVMTIALFTLALELTRSTRVGRRLVDQSLRIAELVATTDPLTGIANRRPAWERLEAAALEGLPLSVGLADLDRFKALNDTCGHDCGDDALQHVARTLTAVVREGDLVARWGGEEFVMLIGLPLERALPIFERARRRVAESQVPCSHGAPHRVTLSMGVAEVTDADPAAAISAADAALYRAKAEGRDRVVS
jgi:diguanylate cyclase (GGDEF)-like protein